MMHTANEIDITHETCPMTFVRTRLALDRLADGELLGVTLRGDEPLRNVSASATALGHEIISTETHDSGISRLLIKKQHNQS